MLVYGLKNQNNLFNTHLFFCDAMGRIKDLKRKINLNSRFKMGYEG
jgi:hypothetical protein